MGTIILSALVAHTAWHWMLDRAAVLSQYHFAWPAFNLAFLASATRGAIVVLIALGALWLLAGLGDWLAGSGTKSEVGAN